jgi:hypothetical protein
MISGRVGAGAVWTGGGDACVALGGGAIRGFQARVGAGAVGTRASPMMEQLSHRFLDET